MFKLNNNKLSICSLLHIYNNVNHRIGSNNINNMPVLHKSIYVFANLMENSFETFRNIYRVYKLIVYINTYIAECVKTEKQYLNIAIYQSIRPIYIA